MPTTPVSRAWHKNLSDVSAKRLDQFAEWSRHLLDFSAKRWDKLVEWSRQLMELQVPTVQPEQNLAVGLVSFPVVLVTSTLGEKTALSS
jgi:predicted LPLAT superfamily acyltransferase